MDRSLRRELKSAFGNENYWFDTTSYLETVEIQIKTENKTIQFFFPKENRDIIGEIIFIMDYLALYNFDFNRNTFLKNQTRPIVRLAKTAERFGKGDYVNEFRTSGALEIRKAFYEFDKMAKRIK